MKLLSLLLLLTSCSFITRPLIVSEKSSLITSTDTTKFGILTPFTGPQEMAAADSVGVKLIRRSVMLDNISVTGLLRLQTAGYSVVLNVNWGSARDGAVPFPKDTVFYKQRLTTLLSQYKPELVVIENEELNDHYHSGTAQEYLNELRAAVGVCHSFGVKVTNGGIGSAMCIYTTYKGFTNTTAKNDFAKRMIPENLVAQVNKSTSVLYHKVDTARQLIAAYKVLDLDYINVHWYQPAKIGTNSNDTVVDVKAIGEVLNYFSAATGHKAMSNETGQLNTSPYTVTATMQAFKDNHAAYFVWFGSDGGSGAVGFWNETTGAIRSNGKAYKSFQK